MSDAPKRDRKGEEVAGRYVIEREIGSGGMGTVYAALDVRLGRRVALKTLSADPSPTTRQRLETEARAVASVEHPGIVTLYDVVEHAGETVLVMELVAGETLREIVRVRSLSAREVADIVYEVSDALAAAHAKNLVHRDVKPDNIMVRTDGRIALLDFGVAKITASAVDPAVPTTTGEGVIVGTPAYLAPEQARGEAIGPATDQFALAVTAYELLSQSLPWTTTTPLGLVAAILTLEPTPLPGFDEVVQRVLARALAKAPSDRFADVRELATALGDALGVPNPLRPRSLMPGASSRPHPAPASTIELGKTLRATESQNPSTAPVRRSQRSRRWWAVASVVVASACGVAWLATHRRKPPPLPPPVASAASSTLALADVPPSETKSEVARAKFHEAMRMLSLGRGPAVFPLLDAAIEADPEFASAHLQRAFSAYRISGGLDAVGRRAYAAALERKGKLSARDAELLNAIGPSFADPPNWQESGKRLEAMLAKRPGDAQAWEALGILRFKNSQLEAAVIAFEHENAADPNAYAPYFFRGHARASAGDIAGARKFFEQCNDRIPTNIECRGAVGAMYRVDGDCTAADRVAREAAALAPDQPLVYTHRAESAAALGATNGALSELLAQKRALMPEARRASEKLSDDFHLAMRIGDFASALAALDAIDHNADDSRPDQRVKWIVERARLLWEMGEPAKSATFSLTYLDRMTAQMLPEQPWQDPTGQLLAIANASGRISNGDYVERRDKWIDAWRTRLGVEGFRNDGTSVWLAAFANVDPSPERATEALAVLPKFGPYDVLHPDITTRQFDPEIGAMFLAAGKLEEAEARLGAATRWCRLVPYVHAFYSLGETRARRGNKVGACEAFATVERTWGRATPKSVTLEAARRAMKKYGCPTVPSSSSKP